MGLCMLLLLHAIICCFAGWILPCFYIHFLHFRLYILQHLKVLFLIIYPLFIAPSAPPTNISATAVSARALNITWQPPELAEQNGIIRSYILTLSVTETGSSELLMSDQPQLMLEDLHPFYLYSFLIAAITISPGPYSEIVSIQMPQAGQLK